LYLTPMCPDASQRVDDSREVCNALHPIVRASASQRLRRTNLPL
jgi:hypothetical protein